MNLSLLYMRSYCFLPLFCGFRNWRLDQFFAESVVSLSSCGAATAAAASTTAPDAKPGRQSTVDCVALVLAFLPDFKYSLCPLVLPDYILFFASRAQNFETWETDTCEGRSEGIGGCQFVQQGKEAS